MERGACGNRIGKGAAEGRKVRIEARLDGATTVPVLTEARNALLSPVLLSLLSLSPRFARQARFLSHFPGSQIRPLHPTPVWVVLSQITTCHTIVITLSTRRLVLLGGCTRRAREIAQSSEIEISNL
jgi:hypothetical protein